MNEQYEKSLTKLELDKVLALLADHAASQAAKERCLAIRPSTDADEIRHLLDETSAACACITVKGSPSFGGLYDVGASLDRADRGGCLSPEELLRIAAVLKSARQTKAYSEGEGRDVQEPSVLDVYFQQITANKYLEERIFTSILSKDEIADAASSELASIRRKIRQQSAKIRESLQKIITSPSYAKILQEPIVTIRSDRFVVPVKAECKSQLPGLVHDVSSSGSTYFIEPMSAVNGNNELRELFMAERKEIERILAELSAEAAGHREQIKLDYDVLRPQHRRQDRHAQDHRSSHAHGRVRPAYSRRRRQRGQRLRAGFRRHRRRTVHRAVAFHVLVAYKEYCGDPQGLR